MIFGQSKLFLRLTVCGLSLLFANAHAFAQEAEKKSDEAAETTTEDVSEKVDDAVETTKKRVGEAVESTKEMVSKVAEDVDKSEQAKEISAGILGPIYSLAEGLAFPAFHWVAFALMATGVVSYALQLVLGKLIALAKLGFSPAEILSDALGLAISLIGLVLTTQAAAENSTFTTSAAAVLSASAVGLVAGIIFYFWGQAQELAAIEGRRKKADSD